MTLLTPAGWRRLAIISLALLFSLLMAGYQPLASGINEGVTMLVVIALLWLTEALPLTVTALLVPVMATLLELLPVDKALAEFANPVIFLFLGGFALAAALHRQQLDSLLARRIVALARGRLWLALLLLFAATALLSMWISNTTTAAIMLPLALGLTAPFDRDADQPTVIFTLLGVGYSASIGGLGTLVGTPPNAIAAAHLGLSFADWLKFGLPLMLLFMPLMVVVLYCSLRPNLRLTISHSDQSFAWTRERRLTVIIFALTVAGWVLSQPLATLLGGIKQFDTLVALLAVVAVSACRVASWEDIRQGTDWGVLLLFGGGLTLSVVLQQSGTSGWLADQLAHWLAGTPRWLMLLALTLFVIFLSELLSNTALAALLIPLFAPMAEPLGLSPVVVTLVIAIGASCAFMLPVGTPPNAIMFATGKVPQRTMMRAGLWLNLSIGLLLSLLAGWLGTSL